MNQIHTIPPSCRNLAFSGNPGTGKSVTARMAAQILREEGCGSGRFVEAGREQLIGHYLGQTSPMIADLFRRSSDTDDAISEADLKGAVRRLLAQEKETKKSAIGFAC